MESRNVASKTPRRQQGSTSDVDVGSYKSELIVSLTCDSSAASVNNCDEIITNSAASNADVSVGANNNDSVIENNSDTVNGNKIAVDSDLANDIAINGNLINACDDKAINISANDDHAININNAVGANNDSVSNFVSDTSVEIDDKDILNKQENNNNLLKECIGNESVINSVEFCDNTNDNALSRCVTFGELTDIGASEKHSNDKDCLIYSGADKNVFDEKCIDNVQSDSSVKSTDTESDDFSDEKVTFRVRVVENSPPSNTKPLKSILKSPKRELSSTQEKSETVDDQKVDDIIESTLEIKRAKPVVPQRVSSLPCSGSKSNEEKSDKSEYDTTVKNVQNRLAESKSKIDELQKSLPTRLSSATVESLKIKYSPASFGYPKTFLKSTEDNQLEATRQKLLLNKIPVQSNLKDDTPMKDVAAVETVKVKDFENSERKSSQTDEDIIKNILFGNKKKIEKKDSLEDRSSVEENKPVEVKLINSFVYPDSEQKSNSEISKEYLEKSVLVETSNINQDRINEKIKTDETKESNNSAANSDIKPIEIENNKKVVEKLSESDTSKINISDHLKDNNQDISVHETNVKLEENIVPGNTDLTNSTKEIGEQIIIEEEKRDAYADLIKQFTMADKKDSKKRSNSFRRIFPSGLFGSSKDKHKHSIDSKKTKSDKNGVKKSQHNSFSTENAHNEIEYFDRQRAERHTVGHYPYYYNQRSDRNNYVTDHGASTESYYSNSTYTPSGFVNKPTTNYGYQQGRGNLNLRQVKRDGMYSETPNDSFVTSTPISENFPAEDYVCMDNMSAGTSKNANIHLKDKYVNINNYFDASTSSSTSTLTSDTPCYTYDSQQGRRDVSRISSSKTHNTENDKNMLRRYYAESKLLERNATKSPEQFTQALCLSENNQDPELIKPKAIIPINTERPLANPYHNVKDNMSHSDAEQLYGNLAYADDEDEDDYEMDQKTIPYRDSEIKSHTLSENILQQQTSVDTSEKLKSFQNANKSPYETIYNVSVNKSSVESGIKSNNVENSNSTGYGSLIPVSAHVKISKTPIISPKKSIDKLRARSLSPEQRYKLDVPKTNQTVLPDSPTKKLSTPLKNKFANKTSNKHEDIKRNDVVEEESGKISNVPKNLRKSPKSEKKINKNIKSPEQQRKTRNSPTHQNLEIELDYPDNNLNENRIQKVSPQKDVYVDKKSDVYTSTPNSSRQENYKENDGFTRATNFQSPKEASTFENVQASKIPMKENYEDIVTNHPKNSSDQSENCSRNVKSPLAVQTQPSPSSIQIQPPLSPQKQQMLQHVEAFYWSQKQKEAMQNSPNRSSVSSRSPSRISIDSPTIQTLTQAVVHHNNPSPQYFSNQRLNSPQNVPINRNTNSPIINQRTSLSKIPQPSSNSPTKQTISVSPQKIQNLQNVEAFYWQKIREMKEKEEEEIIKQHQILLQQQNYTAIRGPQPPVEIDSSRRIRSRSVSPGFSRHDKRSLSLPRGVNYYPSQGNNQSNISESQYGYSQIPKQAYNYQSTHLSRLDSVPSNRTIQNTLTQNQTFVRNSLQRNTIGPINSQRNSNPRNIITDVIYENYIPGVQLRNQEQAVPRSDQTSAGYAPIFKRGSLVSNTPSLNQDSSLQSLKKVSFSGGIDNRNPHVWPTKDGFTKSPPTRVKRLDSGGSDNVFTPSPSSAVTELKFNDFPQSIQKYQNNSLSPESVYGKTTPKQVTVTNKVCDIYGKIHDQDESKSKMYGQIQKTGVIYGELKKKLNNDPYNPTIYQASNKPLPRSPTTVIGPGGKPVTGAVPRIVTGKDGKPLKIVSKSLSEMKISQTDSSRPVKSAGSVLGLPEAPNRPLPPVPPGMGGNRHVSRSTAFRYGNNRPMMTLKVPPVSESESGSEAGEVQRILQQGVVAGRPNAVKGVMQIEEEWSADGKSGRGPLGSESGGGGNVEGGELRGSRGRSTRRDDPRRHTLSGDQHLYPGGGPGHQGGVLTRTMDLEASLPRGYPPPSSAMLFDDDPGIMSEVETSSTGFRRGGKQRSSLPVVRTPSKTLERPLGLVFLQYRNETKRALLPNEITSIDTVKALFVRSFPKQLTMEYLDSPLVKIYIHDSSKDMFYELEDVRSHLRDIRDRSVLRLFESADVSGGLPGAGTGIAAGIGHFEDQSYFSEPEFDSDYQHQHIHKSKTSGKVPYYMGSASTIPRGGGPLLRTYSPAVGAPVPADRIKSMPGQTGLSGAPPKPMRTYSSSGAGPQPPPGARGVPPRPPDRYAPFLSPAELRHRPDTSLYSLPDRMHTDGYMSSPERGSRGQYEDPYYSQFNPRSGSITPVIDEEARIRVEHMERQLANLTGLVQKALTQAPPTTRDYLQVPAGRENFRTDETYLRSDTKAPKLGKGSCHKSVSFEKSVSFSDEPPDMNSPKQHSPQHAERDRLKPAPPPKPAALTAVPYETTRHIYRDLQLTPEMYNQLRGLQKKAKDLRAEVRNLRRMSQAQAHSVRETIRDTFIKIRAMLLVGGEQAWQAGVDQEKVRLTREEDLYKQEMIRLEKDLTDLESTVEELRGNVINRKTRVNMSDVENMALVLSKSSKTVADLKVRFPNLQEGMKSMLSSEMEKVVREEKFLKEEPERLESALRRCKKLTGTLVTLKRLASVQEQRLPCSNNTPDGRMSPSVDETPPVTPTSAQHGKSSTVSSARPVVGPGGVGGDSGNSEPGQRPENALDALLDELQTFSRPSRPPTMADLGRKSSMDSHTLTVSTGTTGGLRRLHSYPSGSDTDNSPPIQPAPRAVPGTKPPLPERNPELMQALAGRRVPPPPPPRTSSRSPLASPTSPGAASLQHIQNVQNMTQAETQQQTRQQSQFEAARENLGLGTLRRNVPGRASLKERSQTLPRNIGSNLQVHTHNMTDTELQSMMLSASNSSSCESVNSQEGAKKGSRQEQLELRHQELLKKQKALQEQYARLQQLQRGNNALTVIPPTPDLLLKKTGSESNLLQKMGLNMSTPQFTGSLTHLANTTATANTTNSNPIPVSGSNGQTTANTTGASTTSKVYETDIL